jgi:hypothetical protein
VNKETLLLVGIIAGILIFLIYPVYGLLGTVLLIKTRRDKSNKGVES